MEKATCSPHDIREKVFATLSDINPGGRNERGESILFTDGRYAGHRFRVGGLQAVWMLNEDRIVVLNNTGRPIREFTMAELLDATSSQEERKAG